MKIITGLAVCSVVACTLPEISVDPADSTSAGAGGVPTQVASGGRTDVPDPENPGIVNSGGSDGSPLTSAPPAGGSGGSVGTDTSAGAGGQDDDGPGLAGAGGQSNEDPVGTDVTPTSGCNTPEPVPGDIRNWFTTNTTVVEYQNDWFQLITPDGFSEDGCTYTGKIQWFHEGEVDPSTNQVWWESDGLFSLPLTVFTIHFNPDGTVQDSVTGSTVKLGGGFSYESCGNPNWPDSNETANLMQGADYKFHECIRDDLDYHDIFVAGFFAGFWNESTQSPQPVSAVPAPNLNF